MRKALAWVLFLQLMAFIVMVGSTIGCVVIVQKEKLSFEMILGVISTALAVAGFGYSLMSLTNWRLFFFSTVLVTNDRLVRYYRPGRPEAIAGSSLFSSPRASTGPNAALCPGKVLRLQVT
jgi:hypothetical protein